MPRSSSAKGRYATAPKYIPTPKQKEFHQSPAQYRGFIGGFGSGKSVAGAMEAWKHIGLYPGSFGLIGRLEFTALAQSSMRTFFQWGPPGGWKYNSHEHKLYVDDGAGTEVLFWHLDDPDPLRSMEFDWVWVDEAHEVPEDTMLMLQSRLRGRVGPHRMWITSNPNGHDWMWRWFINKTHLPEEYQDDYFGVVAKTEDNIGNLPEGYLDKLKANYPEEWIKRYLDASFDVFEGQIYHEFSKIHVVDPYPIPSTWKRLRGMDIGLTNPTVVLWAAVDPDGRLVIYDEFYRTGAEPGEVVMEIMRRDGLAPWPTYMDPAAAQRTAASKISAMRQYQELGLRVIPANNAVWPGILAVKQRLKVASDGFPRLFIMRNCRRLIEEMRSYRWESRRNNVDELNPPERPLKKDDHGPDALRYICMALPISEVAQEMRKYERQPPRRRIRSKVAGY